MRFKNLAGLLVSGALLCAAGCATGSADKAAPADDNQAQEDAVASSNTSEIDPAQLAGTWTGQLNAGGIELPIVFHLEPPAGDGAQWEATMDSPNQGAVGIPVSEVSLDGREIQLTASAVGGVYEGALDEDNEQIQGKWTQNGQSFELNLVRDDQNTARGPERPQEPEPPYPYKIEEVTFDGGRPTAGTTEEVTLAGTLTLPEGEGPFPAVALLTGSGPQDRDETLMGHKPFWIIADFLSRHGVAVLRFDDRGVAESTGVFQDATIDDFTTDAIAAVDYLRTRDDIDHKAVGLLGHSEGANVAPQASLTKNKVDFMVLLAPTAVPGTELLARQNALILEGSGMSAEGAKTYEKDMLAALKKLTKVPLDDPLKPELVEEVRKDFQAAADAMSPEDRRYYGPSDPDEFQPVLDAMIAQLSMRWMRSFLALKPEQTFPKVDTPTLALFGSNDLQVPADQNEPALKKLLPKSADATIIVLDGLNHLFQPSQSGLPAEYVMIETTVAPDALQAILDWMVEQELTSDESPGKDDASAEAEPTEEKAPSKE